DMGYAITSVVRAGQDTVGLISKYKEISDFYNKSTSEYIDATFLKNHDQNRILSELDNNPDKARVAAGILLTLPGTPYIYYGEEIGMLGVKPDEYIREPFIWDEGKKDAEQTSWETPKYSTDQTVIPLSKQKNDPNSLFNFYKKFINYRNSSSILTYGSIENSPLQVREMVSFIRKNENGVLLIIHNISDVELTLKREGELADFDEIDFTTNTGVTKNEDELIIPAYTSIILK
ncbi:MAG: alpha-amylase family glycosyl hydrolase, partial [Cyclobacteriaceae bacterium]